MARITKESIDRFYDNHLHLDTRTVFIGDDGDDGVDAKMSQNVIKTFHILGLTPEKPITIYLNSFGGCWFNGMAIYDAIKTCPCPTTIYVCGAAMSMGSIILQAASERIIYPNATLMLHDGYESRVGDIPQTFINWAEYSKKTRAMMYEIYAGRTGRSAQFWRKKCAADYILTAKEALALGLVDSIYGA